MFINNNHSYTIKCKNGIEHNKYAFLFPLTILVSIIFLLGAFAISL